MIMRLNVFHTGLKDNNAVTRSSYDSKNFFIVGGNLEISTPDGTAKIALSELVLVEVHLADED
jgi:hypothetical protein